MHLAPPQLAATATDRCRVWVPPPQLAEHDPYPPHEPHLQSTGQHWLLQPLVSELAPLQVGPPQLAETATVRERLWVPPPQLAEQEE